MRAAAAGQHPAQAAEPGRAAPPETSPAVDAWAQPTTAATGRAPGAGQDCDGGARGLAGAAEEHGQGFHARVAGAHADPAAGFGAGRRAGDRAGSRFGFACGGGPGGPGAAAPGDDECSAANPPGEEVRDAGSVLLKV